MSYRGLWKMKSVKRKQKPAKTILNKYVSVDRDQVRRFVKVDYPVYCLPVEITERTSEPYEEIERNMERLLHQTDIDDRVSLFRTMGIDEFKQLSNNTLEYLMSINHIDEQNGKLRLTPLGEESLMKGDKLKIERSARLIYFDALSLQPLPEKYYNPRETVFLSPLDWEDFKGANVLDIWEDLPQDMIRGLLRYDGEDRLKYNIPQEMIDIKIDEGVLDYKQTEILSKGIIYFVPIYIAIIDTINGFVDKVRSHEMLDFAVYNVASGKRDDFFEELIKKNYDKIWYVFSSLYVSDDLLAKTEEVRLWGASLSQKISSSNLALESDQNLALEVLMHDVDGWIEADDKEPLYDLAYNNLIPISGQEHSGRLIRLYCTDEVRRRAIDYLLSQKREALRNQDKSEAYIENYLRQLEQIMLK